MTGSYEEVLELKYGSGESGGAKSGPPLSYGREKIVLVGGRSIVKIVVPAMRIEPTRSWMVNHVEIAPREICNY